MAKRIKSQFIDTLNERLNIVDVISSRVPSMKKKGRNYQALCPFHNEKTPSFSVEPVKGFYKCFGCGVSGNAIKFVMEFEHLTFVEAVEKLASEVGMTVEYEHNPNYSPEKAKAQKTAYDILEQATQQFQHNFASSEIAKNYLVKRGVSEAIIHTFRLGFAQTGNQILNTFTPDISASDLQKTGLVAQGDRGLYDQFRNRLMFPIRNHKGQVVGFGGRVFGDAKPKYLNSGESDFFQKRFVLYGLYETLKASTQIERIIVVEGYMDVIALFQSGIIGAVATLGTSLTEDHVPLMRRFSHKICICFDGDKAGKMAADRAADNLLKTVSAADEIRMVFLPEGEDPDTLVRRIGKTAFDALLDNGQVFSEYLFSRILSGQDPNIVEGRAEINRRSREMFAQMPNSEYKSLLQKGLSARLGEDDVAQNAFQATPQRPPYSNGGYGQRDGRNHGHNPNRPYRANTHFNRDNRNTVNRQPPPQSLTAEAKLVRIAVEYPDVCQNLPNLSILEVIQTLDAVLLRQVIDIFHANGHISSDNIVEMLPDTLKDRFTQILRQFEQGWFPIADEAHEVRKERLSNEFSETFRQLISKQLKLLSIRKTPPA